MSADKKSTCTNNEQVDKVSKIDKGKSPDEVAILSPVLNEKDFYPPEDNRCWQSGVEDINGGDNFANYAEDFFRRYEDEGW